MEINLENKAKFFAQYWGQKVLFHANSRPLFINFESLVSSVEVINGYSSYLKRLSSITDEDAVAVLKIFGTHSLYCVYQFITKKNTHNEIYRQVYSNNIRKDGGHQGIDDITVHANFSDKGLHAIHSNRDETYWKALDYLRSKGYALPFMGFSVDKMVEAGWIKLAES